MDNYFKLFIITLITALTMTACGGGSDSWGGESSVDDLAGKWEGLYFTGFILMTIYSMAETQVNIQVINLH